MPAVCSLPTYQRRQPEESVLYRTLEAHLDTFLARTSEQEGGGRVGTGAGRRSRRLYHESRGHGRGGAVETVTAGQASATFSLTTQAVTTATTMRINAGSRRC